ncbi:MAG: hypothetical protein ACKUBY_04425 [Candidatus Moraniibacteriota bacterium]|jgi:hypothetical protein
MKKYIFLCIYIIVLALASYSNLWLTRLDSVLMEPVLNNESRFVIAQSNAKNADVILSNDVLFRITVKNLSDKSRQFIIDFSKRVKTVFEANDIVVNVASVATITDYSSDPVDYFLSENSIKNSSGKEWFESVASHDYMNNVFVNSYNGEYSFFISVMPVNQDVNEFKLYQISHSIMYNHDFVMIDMYFDDLRKWLGLSTKLTKVDFGENIQVDVFGWSVWRTLINKESFSFIFSVLIVGSLLPAITIWIILGSFRQMFISLICNVSILWMMRGLIGVIDLVTNFSFHEETYTILAYIPVMMLNYSFFMRHFKEYNTLAYSFVSQGISSRIFANRQFFWNIVLREYTLKSSVYFVVIVTCIEFLIFMLLPHIEGARSMLTVAILATVSIVVFTIPVTRVILPVIHCFVGGLGKESAQLETSFFVQSIVKFSVKKYSWLINAMVVMALIMLTVGLYNMKLLVTDSDPGAFVRATSAGVVMDSLENEGQPGSGLYKIFVEDLDLCNATDVENLSKFVSDVRNNSFARGIISPTDFLGDVLHRDFYDFCNSPSDCMREDVLSKISTEFEISVEELLAEEWGLVAQENVSKYFFVLEDNSVIINVTGLASKASDMRYVRDALADLGSDIGVVGVDKTAQYPETDDLITVGAIGNYVGSPVLIGVLSVILFLIIGRVSIVSGFNPLVAGAIVIVPFVVSTTLTLIVMMMFGIYLDIATAAIGNITVSAAADLPVFLILRFRQVIAQYGWDFEKNLVSDDMVDEVTRAGADVLVNALTYLPLAMPFLVAFKPIINLGLMLLVALVGCYLGTLLSLPFLRWCCSSK